MSIEIYGWIITLICWAFYIMQTRRELKTAYEHSDFWYKKYVNADEKYTKLVLNQILNKNK